MIEFDETEFLNSAVEDSTLGVLFSFIDLIGREAYDGLLYSGDKHVRLNYQHCRNAVEIRGDTDSTRNGFICSYPDQNVQEEAEEVFTLADSG